MYWSTSLEGTKVWIVTEVESVQSSTNGSVIESIPKSVLNNLLQGVHWSSFRVYMEMDVKQSGSLQLSSIKSLLCSRLERIQFSIFASLVSYIL